MNANITAIIDRFNAEVEAKLQEALTAILGHAPEPEELRGRTRKEVVFGIQKFYLDDRLILKALMPKVEEVDGGYELTWKIEPCLPAGVGGCTARAKRLPLWPDVPEVVSRPR